VAQPVEVHRRIDPGCAASRIERALLLRFAPRLAIIPERQMRTAEPPYGLLGDEIVPLLRQQDVARLAAFAGAHP
jgi:hypothetical protein